MTSFSSAAKLQPKPSSKTRISVSPRARACVWTSPLRAMLTARARLALIVLVPRRGHELRPRALFGRRRPAAPSRSGRRLPDHRPTRDRRPRQVFEAPRPTISPWNTLRAVKIAGPERAPRSPNSCSPLAIPGARPEQASGPAATLLFPASVNAARAPRAKERRPTRARRQRHRTDCRCRHKLNGKLKRGGGFRRLPNRTLGRPPSSAWRAGRHASRAKAKASVAKRMESAFRNYVRPTQLVKATAKEAQLRAEGRRKCSRPCDAPGSSPAGSNVSKSLAGCSAKIPSAHPEPNRGSLRRRRARPDLVEHLLLRSG